MMQKQPQTRSKSEQPVFAFVSFRTILSDDIKKTTIECGFKGHVYTVYLYKQYNNTQ